jgi:hypothetical protein
MFIDKDFKIKDFKNFVLEDFNSHGAKQFTLSVNQLRKSFLCSYLF